MDVDWVGGVVSQVGLITVTKDGMPFHPLFRCDYASLQEVVSTRPSVPCYFRKTKNAIFHVSMRTKFDMDQGKVHDN